MTARESHKTEGFILRCLNYGESDLIVTFYSREYGKFAGIAKGAKRSKKRFANVFEPFSLTNIIFTRKNHDGLAFVDACDVANHYHPIREDLEKTLTASYFIDLVSHFSPEGKKNEKMFGLLHNFLELIENEAATEAVVRFFELRLLKLAGFEPALDHCISCKAPVANGSSYYFYANEGGIKCASCVQPNHHEQLISAGTVRTLLLGKDMEIKKIKQISLSSSLALESRSLLGDFISHVLGGEVKSLKIMEQVRKIC